MKKITASFISSIYKPRQADSHKGSYGHALLIAGNTGKMGAAVIATKACLRSGVGLLTVLVPKTERIILQTSIPEAMLCFNFPTLKETGKFKAIGIGPGLGTKIYALTLLQKALQQKDCTLVIDADALNGLSENKNLLKKLLPGTILTPHVKEFDRLFGEHISKEERMQSAIQHAGRLGVVMVLKDSTTLITDGKQSYIHDKKNSGLAKGGSGDALLGIILSLVAQGYEPLHAGVLGVHLHGLAAAAAAKEQSPESMLITDVIEMLCIAFHNIN